MRSLYVPMLVCLMWMPALAVAVEWDISADIRERYQSWSNFNFDATLKRDRWEFDSRLYIRARADWGHGLRVVLQPQAVLIQDYGHVNGMHDLSQADLLQAYVQYTTGNVVVRLGRQQLVYGDQRLLGHLGWKDVARTFDGVKGRYASETLSIDVFSVHPADIEAMTPTPANPHGQSLVTWEDRRLDGVYATYLLQPETGMDVYMINWRHNQYATVGRGRNIHTVGARLFAQWQGLGVTAESVFQRGTWLNTAGAYVAQRASAYAISTGYTFALWHTRLGLEYDFSPGDDKANPAIHKNFVFPFHTNHMHYGEMDFFSWANMQDLRLSLKTSPLKGLNFMVNVHWLSLAEARGDWLNIVGTQPVFPGAPGYTKTRAGTEMDLKLAFSPEAMEGLKLVLSYGMFRPGEAVVERNQGKSDVAHFGYILGQYVF